MVYNYDLNPTSNLYSNEMLLITVEIRNIKNSKRKQFYGNIQHLLYIFTLFGIIKIQVIQGSIYYELSYDCCHLNTF